MCAKIAENKSLLGDKKNYDNKMTMKVANHYTIYIKKVATL